MGRKGRGSTIGGSIIREPRAPLRPPAKGSEQNGRSSRLSAAGQSLTEYRHYALHGFLLTLAVIAIVTAVAGRAVDLTPSSTGAFGRPVAETSAGYLRPPVLLSTVPSVLARHQAEVAATLSPSAAAAASAASTQAPTPELTPAPSPFAQPAYFTYTIQPGDSVASIAGQFGVTQTSILENNPHVSTDPNLLIVGGTLVVPSTDGLVYNVTLGDNLNAIADSYGIDVNSIINYGPNGLTSPDTVVEGMVLVLPGVQIQPSAPDPAPADAPIPAAADDPVFVSEPDPEPAQPPVSSFGSYVWPVSGNITTYFSGYHPGIDIDGYGNYGAPILSSASGTVVLVAWDDYGYGYHVIVQNDDGTTMQYAHLSDIWVSQGQYVGQGQAVGALGSTGYSTGPHLMFNMYVGGVPVDPLAYLP
jgi:murein DD-endopeptidase MepM/ murein hydrolase activator NlpD